MSVESEKHFNKIIDELSKKVGEARDEQIRILFMQLVGELNKSNKRCKTDTCVNSICTIFKLTEEDNCKLLFWATDTYGLIVTKNK
jgi:hypothetical protein